MRHYKSDPGRLARLFKASRETWRAQAAAKQKKLRALEIRVRDLEASRAKWKARAQSAERELATRRRAEKAGRNDDPAPGEPRALVPRADHRPALERAWRHGFALWLVHWAVYQVLVALNSVRGASRSLRGLAEVGWALGAPSAASIRQWLLRLGLYELQRPRPRGEDWVVIVDLSIERGANKVLVMVALPRSQLPPPAPAGAVLPPSPAALPSATLTHQAVQVVDLVVLEHSNAQVIEQRLEQVGQRLGPLIQIVADGGSDVKAGIERYCQRHAESRYTYDVTHKMARLLQRELEPDARFGAFLIQCQHARQALQQTPLSFLLPPAWRRKGRWLQVGALIEWAQRTLDYATRGDFSLIETGYRLDAPAYRELMDPLEPAVLARLNARTWRDYPDSEALLEDLERHLGAETLARHRSILCQATDRGRRRFLDALGWLLAYRSEIAEYAELIDRVKLTQQILKTQGLNAHSGHQVHQAIAQRAGSARVQRFTQDIDDYLQSQTQDLPEGQRFLATSDVLESLFGHYKLISERSPLKEVGQLILTLPLRTVQLSASYIKQALETVSSADLARWTAETLGPSALARRLAALGRRTSTKNQHEESDAVLG